MNVFCQVYYSQVLIKYLNISGLQYSISNAALTVVLYLILNIEGSLSSDTIVNFTELLELFSQKKPTYCDDSKNSGQKAQFCQSS